MTDSFPYTALNRQSAIQTINEFALREQPFLFVINYKADKCFVLKPEEINPEFIRFQINGHSNCSSENKYATKQLNWEIQPVAFEDFEPRFNHVVRNIRLGNSFLINLTQPTLVKTNYSIEELFVCATAKYKLLLKDMFLVLSPESFVKIEGCEIASFPMKGTIDASLPDAENQILNDTKEVAEHATIVDLIRNDLSLVAENVEVKRYRYIEKIRTMQKDLLQVSSEIRGVLPPDFHHFLGEIIFKLLPAGSISGAPKSKTMQIIDEAEGYERGFYTGICGWFDGRNLDSAVMIRFIEKADDELLFKSGGGITSRSDARKEYEELIQKVYVPVS